MIEPKGIKTTDELWEEIKELSKFEPLINSGLKLMKLGELTREHGALAMVVILAKELSTVRQLFIECKNKCTLISLLEEIKMRNLGNEGGETHDN